MLIWNVNTAGGNVRCTACKAILHASENQQAITIYNSARVSFRSIIKRVKNTLHMKKPLQRQIHTKEFHITAKKWKQLQFHQLTRDENMVLREILF